MTPLFKTDFDKTLVNLNELDNNKEYYYFELTAEDDKVIFGTQTSWCGFTEDKPQHEIRKARRVYAKFGDLITMTKQPFAVIHTSEEWFLYYRLGGLAFIDAEFAETNLNHLLKADVSYQSGGIGYVGSEMFNETAFKRAPNPKLRMKVLNRDNRKCRICGRSPDNNIDIELHIHHIKPWKNGGLTNSENLITLCHTCHNGLDPHYDPSLYKYLELKNFTENKLDQLKKKVIHYREIWPSQHNF